ncbi:MAG TPA: TonB-dependent receptor, partial [Candidatus Acidoferrum sp.]|nr:TonB-dependent receptor [Candidatus Acidoferrum sp.]
IPRGAEQPAAARNPAAPREGRHPLALRRIPPRSMSLLALGAALTVLVVPDPGASSTGATVRVGALRRSAGPDGRVTLPLAPGRYEIRIAKPGFVPVVVPVVVRPDGTTVRVALHLSPASALRTIGTIAAAERGAFNRAPTPVTIVPREAYRDQSQAATDDVLTQKPAIAIDRAGRGLSAADAPPVPLVRGGTPLETQTLIEGDPVALATTRTFPLTALPTYVTQEFEVDPGAAATLPAIDGAVNGTLNVRFADPTPAWRALPEQGFDSRGGSVTDLTGGGATPDRKVAFALAGTINGENGDVAATDVTQRAVMAKGRAAVSPASGLTIAAYGEGDRDGYGANRFQFTSAEYRVNGPQSTVLARAWHVDALREGTAAGDPLETSTADALTGGALELDRTVGTAIVSLGISQTYDAGTAGGVVTVAPGANERISTGFVRTVLHPADRWEAQFAGYLLGVDASADGAAFHQHGLAGRAGISYRVSSRLTLRASSGSGFAPPSLVALAGARTIGPEAATTDDLGLEARVIDAHTTLSGDLFSTSGGNRIVEVLGTAPWIDGGAFARRGAEISLARFVPAGLGYLVQAWTASETPSIASTIGDVAAGNTHGYAEISYHWRSGSRVSLGATYYGADPALGQPAVVPLNSNVEIQLGARGKIQFDVENLGGVRYAIPTPEVPVLAPRNAFAPAPRTYRVVVRRSIGRTGTDGG